MRFEQRLLGDVGGVELGAEAARQLELREEDEPGRKRDSPLFGSASFDESGVIAYL